jgi:hypothetical protein
MTEHIIAWVDGQSTDGTWERLRDWAADDPTRRLLRRQEQAEVVLPRCFSLPAARNTLLNTLRPWFGKGTLLLILDADNVNISPVDTTAFRKACLDRDGWDALFVNQTFGHCVAKPVLMTAGCGLTVMGSREQKHSIRINVPYHRILPVSRCEARSEVRHCTKPSTSIALYIAVLCVKIMMNYILFLHARSRKTERYASMYLSMTHFDWREVAACSLNPAG